MKITPIPGPPYLSTPAASNKGNNVDFRKLMRDVDVIPSNVRSVPASLQILASPVPASSPSFATAVTVRAGDTLYGIAQKALTARAGDSSPNAIMRAALRIGKDNNIPDPNFIRPGQQISLASVYEVPETLALAAKPARASDASSANSQEIGEPEKPGQHVVLEKTLERAVRLNYLDVAEKNLVRQKVLDLAVTHNFKPDDLAIVSLIESDGLNPKASNGRCHGIIQFCDGPNNGAASVGFQSNPKDILNLTVTAQLDLMGKYFEDTGLKKYAMGGRASLDDLYLTVLTPAARREKNVNVNLDIAGQQAKILQSTEASPQITRASLLQGLMRNARQKLNGFLPNNSDHLRDAAQLQKNRGT